MIYNRHAAPLVDVYAVFILVPCKGIAGKEKPGDQFPGLRILSIKAYFHKVAALRVCVFSMFRYCCAF